MNRCGTQEPLWTRTPPSMEDAEEPPCDFEEIEWEDWGPSDDELQESISTGEASSGACATPQFVGEGLASAGLGKAIDLAIGLAEKQRRITIKIVNRSKQNLTNPYWSLKDGVTEVNPELAIFGVAKNPTSGEPGTGEAIFRGKTLKGSLSYQIGDKPFAVLILFKVLFFQPEIHLGPLAQYDDRNNQVFITVIPKNEREQSEGTKKAQKIKVKKAVAKFFKTKEDKPKEERPLRQLYLYKKYKGDLKHCAGKYHEYEVDQSKLKGCPKLKLQYSISDVGNAEIRVTVSDCQ